MSFNVTGQLLSKDTKLTGNTATTCLDVGKRVTIVSVICAEIGGNTPNLSIEKFDGTTSYYLRNALAMTAKQVVVVDTPFTLAANQTLRVTSSDASGEVDVFVNYLNPDATAQR